MRILIDVNHPAHVQVFRNAAKDWIAADHAVLFTATDKDVALRLLDAYQLPYEVLYKRTPGLIHLAQELVIRTAKLVRVGMRFQPDVLLSVGSPTAAWASAILRKPHVAFEDTEDSLEQIRLYKPFTKAICVPDCFMRDLGERMVRYPGYHELAYLHPKRFLPDPMKIAPLASNERYFVVRFISWDATHDGQQSGTSEEGRRALIQMLRSYGKVVLSVESHPPVLFDNGHRELDADAMIHLLAFAEMYVGEGVTAASEAAVLGTPSVLINSREVGYVKEQEERYRLGYRFASEDEAIAKIELMLQQDDLKSVWHCRQEVLLRDKIDVTDWMQDFVREVVAG